MGFKVQKNYQEITHFYLSSCHGKIHHGKIILCLKVLDLNKRSEFYLHINKQNNNILKFTNYTKKKSIQLKKMTNKNKQTNKIQSKGKKT